MEFYIQHAKNRITIWKLKRDVASDPQFLRRILYEIFQKTGNHVEDRRTAGTSFQFRTDTPFHKYDYADFERIFSNHVRQFT